MPDDKGSTAAAERVAVLDRLAARLVFVGPAGRPTIRLSTEDVLAHMQRHTHDPPPFLDH